MVQLLHNTGNASKATTWVVPAPSCAIPYYGEVLREFEKKGFFQGLHVESRSVVVHFPTPHEVKEVKAKRRSILREVLQGMLCRGPRSLTTTTLSCGACSL